VTYQGRRWLAVDQFVAWQRDAIGSPSNQQQQPLAALLATGVRVRACFILHQRPLKPVLL